MIVLALHRSQAIGKLLLPDSVKRRIIPAVGMKLPMVDVTQRNHVHFLSVTASTMLANMMDLRGRSRMTDARTDRAAHVT